MFTIARSRQTFKSWTFSINKVIVDFEMFPFYETLLIVDESHDLRLVHETTGNLYKQQSYGHIVKKDNSNLRCFRLGKTDFMVFQTYMIGL
jgi:hypothetical protein